MQQNKTMLLIVSVLVFLISTPVFACFSIIVGKDASATGEIIVGHNEDNDRRIIMTQHYVPRMKHAPGTVITAEPTAARIPQVPETWAYYWTETLAPDGYSFSDGFINEWGVVIVSDSCITSREESPRINEGGIGYGIRRIMAERAKTSREAVEIAANLLNTYGYRHGGRSYQISDKDEVWVLQIVRGNHYVAKRLPNDQVFVMANSYNIRDVDLNDKSNVIASPDLITYAIDRGWYKPAVPGSYSDFDFAVAYQPDDVRSDDFNQKRHRNALRMLMGKEYDFLKFPYSVKPDHKVTPDEVKKILSSHSEGTDDFENKHEGFHYSMNTVCNIDTQESVVIQIRQNPDMILAWKSTGRPCMSGYAPWYPAAGVPNVGYNWVDPVTSQKNHFAAPADWFSYKPERAWWGYIKMQNLLNYQYDNRKSYQNAMVDLAAKWNKELPVIEAKAMELLSEKREKGLEFLYDYSTEQTMLALATVKEETRKIEPYSMSITANEWSLSDKGNVTVVLYSAKGFDATKIDQKNTVLSVAYSDEDTNLISDPAKALKFESRDVNKDGMKDMVITFKTADAVKWTFPDVVTDMYLRTTAGGKKIVTMDTVKIVK